MNKQLGLFEQAQEQRVECLAVNEKGFIDTKSKKIEACWNRWVDARNIQRKFLLPGGAPDWINELLDDCLEKKLFYKFSKENLKIIKIYVRETA